MNPRKSLGERGSALVFLAFVFLPGPAAGQHMAPPSPPAYALENVMVVHGDGRREEGVTLVIRGGLIAAMGAGAVVPPDATVLEGDSLRVYPGMIDGHGRVELELPEPAGEDALPWDAPRAVQGFTPHRMAAAYLLDDAAFGREARRGGVVAAAVHPEGGMAPGRSAVLLFRKDVAHPREAVVRPDAGLFLTFQGARGVYPGTLFGVMAYFRQAFEDASRHGLIRSEYARAPDGLLMPGWDPDYEVLARAASGDLPVFFLASTAGDIRRVLGLAEEIGFRPVIVGGEEAWRVADELRERAVPVLVSVDFPAPREWEPDREGEGADLEPGAAREKERLENAYANASRLVEAGVSVALTSGGRGGDFREGVRKTLQHGLSEDAALRAVTVGPAALLGVEGLTLLREGMAANLIVTDGPLFGEDTSIRYTLVDGKLEEGGNGRRAGGDEPPGADLSGRWEMVVNAEGMQIPFDMRLTQEGRAFHGTLSNPEMGADARVEGGILSGTELRFTLVVNMGAESMVFDAEGSVEGNRITGSGSGESGSFTFTATREPGMRGGGR